jgi:hypothetical protein
LVLRRTLTFVVSADRNFQASRFAAIVNPHTEETMRIVYLVFVTAVALFALLLAAVSALRAQGQQPVMVGMPEYNIVLSGSPDDPVIENHSGKVIIGYNIETADASGRLMGGIGQILAPGVLPAGLPDGKSLYAMGNFPVDPNRQRGNRVINASARSAVRATLTSVIFADGHFVGTDERGTLSGSAMS